MKPCDFIISCKLIRNVRFGNFFSINDILCHRFTLIWMPGFMTAATRDLSTLLLGLTRTKTTFRLVLMMDGFYWYILETHAKSTVFRGLSMRSSLDFMFFRLFTILLIDWWRFYNHEIWKLVMLFIVSSAVNTRFPWPLNLNGSLGYLIIISRLYISQCIARRIGTGLRRLICFYWWHCPCCYTKEITQGMCLELTHGEIWSSSNVFSILYTCT